jgi:hypothetical protein
MEKYKKIKEKIKFCAGILLFICFFLPISKCTYYEDENGNRISSEKIKEYSGKVVEIVQVDHAYDNFSIYKLDSWTTLIVFIWPILLLYIMRFIKNNKVIIIFRFIEVLLILYSFLIIDFLSTFLADSRAYGAYLAFFALGIYSMVVLIDIGLKIKERFS